MTGRVPLPLLMRGLPFNTFRLAGAERVAGVLGVHLVARFSVYGRKARGERRTMSPLKGHAATEQAIGGEVAAINAEPPRGILGIIHVFILSVAANGLRLK